MVHLLLIGKMPGVNSELAETCDFTMWCEMPCHDLHIIISAVETVYLGILWGIVHFETFDFDNFARSCYVVMLLRGNTRLEVVIRLAKIFA